jgi:hypothetical protein
MMRANERLKPSEKSRKRAQPKDGQGVPCRMAVSKRDEVHAIQSRRKKEFTR